MDYAYAVKTLPQPDDPAAEEDPAAAPPEPQPPQEDDARPWAGDVYDEGDESDPAQAYASFSGPSGEQAWLDKAEDGTLTGWVRDETGQVWRYADPEAWAIDVDDAGMAETGGTHGSAPDAEQPAGGEPTDPAAAPDPAAADQSQAGGLPLDFGTADEVVPADGAAPEDPAAGDPAPEETDEEPEGDEPAEDDEDEDGTGKGKRPNPFK